MERDIVTAVMIDLVAIDVGDLLHRGLLHGEVIVINCITVENIDS